MSRRTTRRRWGWGLVVFGGLGLAIVLSAAALLVGSLSALNAAATGFDRQREEILGMVGPASDALNRAADSADHAGASLQETSASARQGAALAARLAGSFDSLAALGSFEVLGARPFGQVSGSFSDVAAESRSLSNDLTRSADDIKKYILKKYLILTCQVWT